MFTHLLARCFAALWKMFVIARFGGVYAPFASDAFHVSGQQEPSGWSGYRRKCLFFCQSSPSCSKIALERVVEFVSKGTALHRRG